MKKLFVLFLLLLPLLIIAQQNHMEINYALHKNDRFINYFAHLAPMGINPYLTVFLTSLCSKLGMHNDFVATNPFFNNWFVVIIFGTLFTFTAITSTLVKTNKATAPIGLVDNYLSKHAALIINLLVFITPVIFSNEPAGKELAFHAGFISLSFKTALIIFLSVYFLIVVMTVRFFIDILIFISPVPIIDSILEILKMVFTVLFVAISIFSPTLSFVICLLFFISALLLYRRASLMVNKTKYLFIYPIINLFKKKDKILQTAPSLFLTAYIQNKGQTINRGKIIQLEKSETKIRMIHKRFLLPHKTEELNLDNFVLKQGRLYSTLSNEHQGLSLLFNRSYHKYLDEISRNLNVPITGKKEFDSGNKASVWTTIKRMFNKGDLTNLKTA